MHLEEGQLTSLDCTVSQRPVKGCAELRHLQWKCNYYKTLEGEARYMYRQQYGMT